MHFSQDAVGTIVCEDVNDENNAVDSCGFQELENTAALLDKTREAPKSPMLQMLMD